MSDSLPVSSPAASVAESSHTPGPWRLESGVILAQDGRTLGESSGRPEPEWRANVALLISAPDLARRVAALEADLARLLPIVKAAARVALQLAPHAWSKDEAFVDLDRAFRVAGLPDQYSKAFDVLCAMGVK